MKSSTQYKDFIKMMKIIFVKFVMVEKKLMLFKEAYGLILKKE